MKLGVTVGKFFPFHLGHDYLIRQAKAKVDHLVVLLGYKTEDAVAGTVRARWISDMHPDVEVILTLDDLPEAPSPWAKRALQLLPGRKPDVAFASEDYGQPWARGMGASFMAIDPARKAFPISGSELRADLGKNWAMLSPPAKAYFAKRIAILGVESSGSTSLAKSLAQHYQTVWVPEYGRYYWEGRRHKPNQEDWQAYEFVNIAQGQADWEQDLALHANRLVVCDTNPLATHIWQRRYLGKYNPLVLQIADRQHYELHILTQPDFTFVQDGTREGEKIRLQMHAWFQDILKEKALSHIVLKGSHSQRLAKAIETIDPLLDFPPIPNP